MRVLVPFGARKIFEVGYVVGLKESSEFKCKNIVKVIDRVFDEEKLELAKWISQKYFCNLSDAIRLLVPPGTSTSFDKIKAKTEKNVYGERYDECEICGDDFGLLVYITSEGNRYHARRSCSGLKRTIRQVLLREVENRNCCMRCAALED